MSRKLTPVEQVAKEWMTRPEFVAAYDALEDEFAVAMALVKVRADAAMSASPVGNERHSSQSTSLRGSVATKQSRPG